LLGLTTIVAAFACGDEQSEATTASLGPPSITITSPEPGACIEIAAAARMTISVENWSLRPPGFCGAAHSQCGFAVFFVDDAEVTRSAAIATEVPVDPVTGDHRIRVELWNDDQEVQLDRDGAPLAAEITVSLAESCP